MVANPYRAKPGMTCRFLACPNSPRMEEMAHRVGSSFRLDSGVEDGKDWLVVRSVPYKEDVAESAESELAGERARLAACVPFDGVVRKESKGRGICCCSKLVFSSIMGPGSGDLHSQIAPRAKTRRMIALSMFRPIRDLEEADDGSTEAPRVPCKSS